MTGASAPRHALAAVLATLVALTLAACGSSSGGGTHPAYRNALAGAPKPLASLYSQANELLPGGTPAFQRRLRALRGHPVVVNAWASWCGPCRLEFPWFQDLSAKLGKRIAFVGVDWNDSSAAARTFLKEYPVPYPSYSDPDKQIGQLLEMTVGPPATIFYDSRGRRVFTRQGQYANQADLAADIRRYAR